MKIAKLLEGSFDRRVILYFQTKAIEYDVGKFCVDAKLVNDYGQKLEIRFPDHYEYDIDVRFLNTHEPRILADIDDRNDDGGKTVYVMHQNNDHAIVVYNSGGSLSNGEDDKICPNWEAAIDFFMNEVDQRIKELWVEDSSLGTSHTTSSASTS